VVCSLMARGELSATLWVNSVRNIGPVIKLYAYL